MEEKKTSKINEFNILAVNIQFILTAIVVILAICGFIINSKILNFCFLTAGLDLFVMAHNNKMVYHKENLTEIYIIAGVLLVIYSLLRFIGVL